MSQDLHDLLYEDWDTSKIILYLCDVSVNRKIERFTANVKRKRRKRNVYIINNNIILHGYLL